MATGFPDWLRAMALMGATATGYKVIAVDVDGNLNIYIRGEDDEGLFHVVAVDGDGQIIMVPRGESGNYMAVDGAGNLAAIMMGDKGLGVLKAVAVDDDGQMIMVPRGESGFYLDVDAAGFLSTILKGWDGSEYKPLQVDDDGKLNAFIYDTVDAWAQTSTVGLSELAARLGSPVRYERSGQVYLIETFENGLQHWQAEGFGGAGDVGLTAETCASGGYCVKMVAGNTVPHTAEMIFKGGLLPAGRMGFSAAFALIDEVQYISFLIRVYDGEWRHTAEIRFVDVGDILQVNDHTAGITPFSTFKAVPRYLYSFNTFKVVFDLTTGYYSHMRLNAVNYPLTTYELARFETGVTPHVYIEIELHGRDEVNDLVYIDDVIVTWMEP